MNRPIAWRGADFVGGIAGRNPAGLRGGGFLIHHHESFHGDRCDPVGDPQVHQSCPPRRSFIGHRALTTWKINWRTRVSTVNGQCQLDSLTVDTAISITLPNWRPPTNAPPGLTKRWSDYYLALLKHELNHAEPGRLAAGELRRRVLEVPPQADCGLLQRRIQEVADQVIAEYKQRDADYDREMAHGLKERARLP